jgi:putative aminopeptidase FrvX
MRVIVIAVTLLIPSVVYADIKSRLVQLLSVPGISGHEQAVRAEIEMLLPISARVRADNMGNIVLRTGSGSPHTLIIAPLDEPGVLVSGITDDGYLRVHRHTGSAGPALATQFLIGQPVLIRTSTGQMVAGVTATRSTHLSRFQDSQDEARIKDLDDVWIDVGAESRAEVEKRGIRILDSVTLRERATRLAGTRVSGVGAGGRAAALAAIEVVRRRPVDARPTGQVTIAWVVQSEYGHRGLLRVMETVKPDRVILLRGAVAPGTDPSGALGMLGQGPILQGDRSFLSEVAARDAISTQGLPLAQLASQVPKEIASAGTHIAMLPVRYAQTPVETVDAKDVDLLARLIAGAVGFGALVPDGDDALGVSKSDSFRDEPLTVATLADLIGAPGVSGHEGPVRDAILKRMPSWAKPQVDSKGNVRVTFGPPNGKAIVFMAHMDEVGFEITNVMPDGTATIRTRGGMYLSVYEAHPVVVYTPNGRVAAVLAPRRGYPASKTAQPDVKELVLDFGTTSQAETAALGVALGHSATVRKELTSLSGHRSTGRAMDDRNGSTAMLMALAKIDPAKITNRVTFAWTVEEETGLAGAAFIAGEMAVDTAFAIDTFVSSDTPVDNDRIANLPLGRGAVLRGLDSRTIVPAPIIDRIVGIARNRKIPLQVGVTSGGTDASVFSERGAIDVGLSWPGRYSHSPVEVMDRRDLDALIALIAALVVEY